MKTWAIKYDTAKGDHLVIFARLHVTLLIHEIMEECLNEHRYLNCVYWKTDKENPSCFHQSKVIVQHLLQT